MKQSQAKQVLLKSSTIWTNSQQTRQYRLSGQNAFRG